MMVNESGHGHRHQARTAVGSMRRGLLGLAFGIMAATQALAEAAFQDHPSPDVLPPGAAVVLPDFEGRDEWASDYRTRLRNGALQGPNFAGTQRLVTIPCGAGCRIVYVIDLTTGEVFPFPYGHEANPDLSLEFRSDSRLIKVGWEAGATCIEQDLIWDPPSFRIANQRTVPREGRFCDFGR